MGFWSEVKTKVQSAFEVVQTNPILDAFATSALESIPVVGGLLVKMYDNSKDSPEDKTEQILELLQKMQNMEDGKLENFCRGLEQNKENILENQSYLKQISQDTSIIIDKLDEAKIERKTIVRGLQRVDNRVDKLYEIIEQLKIQVLQKSEKPAVNGDPNTFDDSDYRVSWPLSWEKLDQQQIQQGIQVIDETTAKEFDIQEVSKEALVLRKKPEGKPSPHINLLKDNPRHDVKGYMDELKDSYENYLGWKVVKVNIDKAMGLGTLEAELNPFGVPTYLIQKFYFRTNFTLILTITQLTQDQLDEDPDYATEVTGILQSLVFLT